RPARSARPPRRTPLARARSCPTRAAGSGRAAARGAPPVGGAPPSPRPPLRRLARTGRRPPAAPGPPFEPRPRTPPRRPARPRPLGRAGLADAARAGPGQHPDRGEQAPNLGQVALAADEARERDRPERQRPPLAQQRGHGRTSAAVSA